jgi:hypothetical protein
MNLAPAYVNMLPNCEIMFKVTDGDPCHAMDHHPMLSTLIVLLQAELLTWMNMYAFYLVTYCL